MVNEYLDPSMALAKTNGPEVIDIDGNKALDISGSYGVNVCGYEVRLTRSPPLSPTQSATSARPSA